MTDRENDTATRWQKRRRQMVNPEEGQQAMPETRQQVIERWTRRVLGDQALQSPAERGPRVAEEAIELAQAMGVDVGALHRLVDYVYARPAGTPGQEIAGTMVTLYAAAACVGADADAEYDKEVARIHTPAIEDKVRRRQAEKREI